MDIRNVVIIGSGCAGHTAALYTARANLKPLLIEGHEPGGQLSMTTLVENFPGFPDGIQGPELVENMRKQAMRFGAEYRIGHAVKADLSKQPLELTIGKERHPHTHAHHRKRSVGALARPAQRTCADRPRCLLVRDLRRLFLLGEGNRGHRGWRLGHGGGDFSDAVCQ